MKFLIVTGMSGAGKSNAVKILEDMGYYCVDNMPPKLITQFLELSELGTGEIEKAAFVVDIRGGEFFEDLYQSINELKEKGSEFKILFLEANSEVLIRRYKETRRVHPMSLEGSLEDGIRKEREKLEEIRRISDFKIDTSAMRPNMLRESIQQLLSEDDRDDEKTIMIRIMSFGYKNGIPMEADNVFDMRFIPNPFYLESLKRLTGNNRKVRDYVMKWDETNEFINTAYDMIKKMIPCYKKQGKPILGLAFGCTGGQHRSVAVANEFYEKFLNDGYKVSIIHRDL